MTLTSWLIWPATESRELLGRLQLGGRIVLQDLVDARFEGCGVGARLELDEHERVELVGEVQLVRGDAHAPSSTKAFEPSINATIFIGVVSLANVTSIVVPIVHPFCSATFLSTAIVLISLEVLDRPGHVHEVVDVLDRRRIDREGDLRVTVHLHRAEAHARDALHLGQRASTLVARSGLNPTLFRSLRSSC